MNLRDCQRMIQLLTDAEEKCYAAGETFAAVQIEDVLLSLRQEELWLLTMEEKFRRELELDRLRGELPPSPTVAAWFDKLGAHFAGRPFGNGIDWDQPITLRHDGIVTYTGGQAGRAS